jgi:hypothetical protein
MVSNNLDAQIQLGEEYQLSPEQIMSENQKIIISLGEIKKKLEDIDERLISLEQQQQRVTIAPLRTDLSGCHSGKKNSSDTVLKKAIEKEKQRSTCFSCPWEKKTCVLYFDDLYDFDMIRRKSTSLLALIQVILSKQIYY